MNTNLLTRRRRVFDQEVREPTLLAIAFTVTGLAVLLGDCAVGIASLSAFGYAWWTFAAVAAIEAWLVLGLRLKPKPGRQSLTSRQRWFRRVIGLGRLLLIGVLACWLGLIIWSAVCPGGSDPAAKTDPSLIRVITWNIHCGQDEGPPWKQFDWPKRKYALRAALDQAGPDILCVQEATPTQVAFLEESLPRPQPRRHRTGRREGWRRTLCHLLQPASIRGNRRQHVLAGRTHRPTSRRIGAGREADLHLGAPARPPR
jgi:hypothetical protein